MPGSERSESPEDERWMAAALALAERSAGLASPNPQVGCVIVKDGILIGEGWHEYDKKDHAEVVALREAGEQARGTTAYVTLEPCSHWGRTGPCADALIRAGVARVVAATTDPNPLVSGQGLDRLRGAGIEVTRGIMQQQARHLNDAFAKYIRTQLPLVTLKAAISADGRIAPAPAQRASRSPVWITGPESRQRVQLMRHAHDAVITGINTVLDDDPLLSDRSALPRRRPLLRVILDSELRLGSTQGLDSKLVRTANNDVLVFYTNAAPDRQAALHAAGVSLEQIKPQPDAADRPRIPLKQVIAHLGQLQITSLMIEAGAHINTSALHERVVDRLTLFQSPISLGNKRVPHVSTLRHGIESQQVPPISPLRHESDSNRTDAIPFVYGVDDHTLASAPQLINLFGLSSMSQQTSGADTLYEARRDDLWDANSPAPHSSNLDPIQP